MWEGSVTVPVMDVVAVRPLLNRSGHLAFFLPATVRLGPLRVRALVLVR